ncbi:MULTISPECIES: ABC transporter ATP-binding protein [Streptomyces]|uniref:ABC transporter ATP-binding protein n=1 Tax=Streptomyces sindenensis TaxID=67363 RepID=A0ABW6EPE7_9ACTN|nr:MULTISPECIES: ABC transporter ATP-binding protein [Streptomyces]WGP11714.1 ABC transporter ATP-binding protein [Streptomyces sp. SH5]GGP71266.1 multidrug ABC transporter ATP-binding protein [Streptomyces sindenensis]
MNTVIRCQDLSKRYGDLLAVDGVSFEVQQGEIFGMIGPNGAGKSTLMECVEGLRTRDSGTVEVLGMDPAKDAAEIHERVGLQLQTSALPPRIKVGEALQLFSSFYRNPGDWRKTLRDLGLDEKVNSYVDKLSGGQRQRVFIALALVNNPELIFVDEITTALDPQSRHAVWDVIRDIRDNGTTVFLTTHFMEEAERLCDRVAIVDHGRLIALDTVTNLINSLDGETKLTFTVNGRPPIRELQQLPSLIHVERSEGRVVARGKGRTFAQEVMGMLADLQLVAEDFRSEQPNLEDVFLSLTGRPMREGSGQ